MDAPVRAAAGPRAAGTRRILVSVASVLVTVAAALVSAVAVSPGTAHAGSQEVSAYWLVASDGGIFAYGGAQFDGSMGGTHLNRPIVGMAGTEDGRGYWLDASDGGIFAFGDAGFHGSMGGTHLNEPVVGMAATPDGGGYWLVASDGGIFAFGDAGFYGSMGGTHLNRPIVGMAVDQATGGYWLVASDGGIFAFNAPFEGSTGNIRLNKPITGMTANPNGQGYWFVASDGGLFAFGDAPFDGSLGSIPQTQPVVAMASDAAGDGYWLVNAGGAVFPFGNAKFWGAPQSVNQPVVGMAEVGASGLVGNSAYPPGSVGYDVSNYQCGSLPPEPYEIGIVEVEGASFGSVNPCLADEASWASGGLNLYVYLTFGQLGSSPDGNCVSGSYPYDGSPTACNYGYETALDAFQKAQDAGVDTHVTWWLDVEDGSLGGSNQAASAAMVQGAIDGFESAGVSGVGIYASPANWGSLVGNYEPDVPYWVADWGPPPSETCADVHSWYSPLPAGPVELVQYASTTYDDDYAC